MQVLAVVATAVLLLAGCASFPQAMTREGEEVWGFVAAVSTQNATDMDVVPVLYYFPPSLDDHFKPTRPMGAACEAVRLRTKTTTTCRRLRVVPGTEYYVTRITYRAASGHGLVWGRPQTRYEQVTAYVGTETLAWISTDRNSPKIPAHRSGECLTSSIAAACRSTRAP
jgi:hypothetical protein